MEKRRMMLSYFLLLTSAARTISEKRLVFQESHVILFENVIADNPEKDVTLYVKGTEQPNLIVKFGFGNGAFKTEWRMNNYTKIFIDANRNIRIANIDKSYEGKYYIQSSGRREVELTISEKNLTEEVKNWLEDHPGFIEEYLGSLTDEVGKKISKWLEDHPGFFMNSFGISDLKLIFVVIITIVFVTVSHNERLSEFVAEVWRTTKSSRFQKSHESMPRDLTLFPVEGDPSSVTLNWQLPQNPNGQIAGSYIGTQEKKGEKQLPGTLTFKDLGVALEEPLTERTIDLAQRMFSEENGILETTNLSSGSYIENQEKEGEKQLHGHDVHGMPTFKDLGVTLMEPMTERNIDLGQRMSSEENGIFETTNLNEDLFYQSGCSVTQPINKEEDSGQTMSVKKPKHFIDEDSDADPTLPLLGDQKALNPQK